MRKKLTFSELTAAGAADCSADDIELEEDEEIDLEANDCPAVAANDRRMAFDRSLRTETVDGRLHVESCNISKANVCPYFGREIPGSEALGLEPGRAYMLYRDKAELEAAKSTYERIPLMMHHVASTADQPNKPYIVGTVSNVRYRHPFLIADITVWDAEAIRVIESGEQRELSCGYRYVVDMSPGEVDGVKFEGRMTRLVGNHVALVEAGRVGPDAFVHDAAVA